MFPGREAPVIEQYSIADHYSRSDRCDKRAEIVEHLFKTPREIPSKYFYDRTGSKLFEKITRLEEYYPARTEKRILRRCFPDIMTELEPRSLVELGSGDCSKISIVLSSMKSHSISEMEYIPVDVSRSAVEESCTELSQRFPELSIRGLVADFCSQLAKVPCSGIRLFCLFGSTIGNFCFESAVSLLSGIAGEMEGQDRFILGLDMRKDRWIMNRAYNDRAGVTANFNRNILKVTGSILSMDIPTNIFRHRAFWNGKEGRMEMHLEAAEEVVLNSPCLDRPLKLSQGEMIHTENSYKYTGKMIRDLASESGMEICRVITDDRKWFSLVEMKSAIDN
ncbi:MAG: L-histidine N(alpha)-methyltransferase [Candidatus Aegiribacteria sp.]|nr:L-histidine N(alpha)-methyltransferase [Candidatus Aegiribacteria sp.]MBD3294188.1 L-histidine N(alpha)-methyltransferase [Candidatus Fermentibacteria bacterium]